MPSRAPWRSRTSKANASSGAGRDTRSSPIAPPDLEVVAARGIETSVTGRGVVDADSMQRSQDAQIVVEGLRSAVDDPGDLLDSEGHSVVGHRDQRRHRDVGGGRRCVHGGFSTQGERCSCQRAGAGVMSGDDAAGPRRYLEEQCGPRGTPADDSRADRARHRGARWPTWGCAVSSPANSGRVRRGRRRSPGPSSSCPCCRARRRGPRCCRPQGSADRGRTVRPGRRSTDR